MYIVFRVDASLEIGNGHVIRCLTLASALQQLGARCRFVCSAHKGNLIALIQQRGFEADELPAIRRSDVPHGTSGKAVHDDYDWQEDAARTAGILANTVIDWMIVDHYALDARWEEQLRPLCAHVMVIDDLANRPHLCEVLLDQNLGRDRQDYLAFTPAGCTVLTGPQFALLQPPFSRLRHSSLQRGRSGPINRLLVTMGGADTENATGFVLEALKTCTLPPDLRVTVVMGPHAPYRDQIINLAQSMPRETEVLINVTNMAELMAQSDLAIGAAGTTSWERCCLGLPTLLLVLDDNQRAVALAQQQLNCAILLPDMHRLNEHLCNAINRASTPGVLARMSEAAAKVTDGEGATRVIAQLFARSNDRELK